VPAQARKRAALELRHRTPGGCEVHEVIFVEVFGSDELGNGGVSNCSIGTVSGEDIVLGKSHETLANRKGFLPQHLRARSRSRSLWMRPVRSVMDENLVPRRSGW
jgi:hypothetical protein